VEIDFPVKINFKKVPPGTFFSLNQLNHGQYKKINFFLPFFWVFSCDSKNQAVSLTETLNPQYKIIGYIAGWHGVDTSKIDAIKLTHINYAFANVICGKVVEGEGR